MTIEELENKIIQNEKLLDQMVGQLYPSIIRNENKFLREELQALLTGERILEYQI